MNYSQQDVTCFLKIIIFCFANKYYSYIQEQKYLQYCYSHNYRRFQSMLYIVHEYILKKNKKWIFCDMMFLFNVLYNHKDFIKWCCMILHFVLYFFYKTQYYFNEIPEVWNTFHTFLCVKYDPLYLMYKIIIIFYIKNYNCVGRNVNFYIFVIVFFGKLKIMQIKSNTKNTNFRNPISKAFYI